MTDYLDELLEQQEEEEQGGMPEWRKVNGAVFAEVEHKTAGAGEEALRHEFRSEELVRKVDSDAWEATGANGRQDALGLLTTRLRQLHRAVRQAQEQGRRAGVSSQTAAQPGIGAGMAAMPLPMRRTADYAAAVDAAFQRDARRYDGPLSLV